jgi:hypothetical protein
MNLLGQILLVLLVIAALQGILAVLAVAVVLALIISLITRPAETLSILFVLLLLRALELWPIWTCLSAAILGVGVLVAFGAKRRGDRWRRPAGLLPPPRERAGRGPDQAAGRHLK